MSETNSPEWPEEQYSAVIKNKKFATSYKEGWNNSRADCISAFNDWLKDQKPTGPTPTPENGNLEKIAFGLANDIQAEYNLEIGTVPDIEKMIIKAIQPFLAAKTEGHFARPVVSKKELSDLIYSKLLDLCRHTVIDGQDACVVINPIAQAPKIADAVIHHLLEGKNGEPT